ncbi:hypothetical protein [Cohnella sp.]|uniref:hypothetical protein n=1 Tax=Cohnella sp. TaxID=1883426 RepID=UPI003569B918
MICPVCNALSLLAVSCPKCGSAAEDEGRWSDWVGPYSPYEPAIAAAAMTETADETICQHSVHCTSCQLQFTVDVPGWHV